MTVKELIDRLNEEDPTSTVYNLNQRTGVELHLDDMKFTKPDYQPARHYGIAFTFYTTKMLNGIDEDKLWEKVRKYIERTFDAKDVRSELTSSYDYEIDANFAQFI